MKSCMESMSLRADDFPSIEIGEIAWKLTCWLWDHGDFMKLPGETPFLPWCEPYPLSCFDRNLVYHDGCV